MNLTEYVVLPVFVGKVLLLRRGVVANALLITAFPDERVFLVAKAGLY